jgi:hypothetical protein
MNYKTMNIEDIIAWCKEQGEVAWLKETAAKKVEYKVYPKVKDASGKMVSDKSATPTIEMRPISFIQIKIAFCEKFMPEIIPHAKEKKVSMYDLIASL